MRRRCLLLCLGVWSCGDSAPPIAQLTLAENYDAVGVARLFPDGLNLGSHRSFSFTLLGMQVSGGRAVGQAQGPGDKIALSGTFDAAAGELVLGPGDGVLTATVSERIVRLGGRADDAIPKDGVAQELVGFVNSSFGPELSEGRFFAVARYEGRPALPDLSKISWSSAGLGKLRLLGTPGAVPTGAGIEVLRHEIDQGPPVLAAFAAMSDGSFDQVIDALSGDLLVVLARAGGKASAPILIAAP